MIKRILLTAVLGGALLFTVVPNAAEATGRFSANRDSVASRDRHDYFGEAWAGYGPSYGFLHFRGFDRSPDLYFYPEGYSAPGSYRSGYGFGYYAPVLTDVFGDDYYFAYGYRCNGYRNGYYVDGLGNPISVLGRPFYRRNADCEDYFHRHGSWWGDTSCDRFDVATGYCDED
jgi:hypothetical protein